MPAANDVPLRKKKPPFDPADVDIESVSVDDGGAWERIAGELLRRDKTMQWLADQLGCGKQRVHNWTTRGAPRSAYPEIAAVLNVSIDWLAGAEKRARTTGELRLSTVERAMVVSFREQIALMRAPKSGDLVERGNELFHKRPSGARAK